MTAAWLNLAALDPTKRRRLVGQRRNTKLTAWPMSRTCVTDVPTPNTCLAYTCLPDGRILVRSNPPLADRIESPLRVPTWVQTTSSPDERFTPRISMPRAARSPMQGRSGLHTHVGRKTNPRSFITQAATSICTNLKTVRRIRSRQTTMPTTVNHTSKTYQSEQLRPHKTIPEAK